MKKIIYPIILVVIVLFAGCENQDVITEERTEITGRMLTVTASMPSDGVNTRVGLEEIPGSLDLSAKWQQEDSVNLFFVQGDIKVQAERVPISNISGNGKQCSFLIEVPMNIDFDSAFDIYGFCGVKGSGVSIRDGKILADVGPEFTCILENLSVPVWFKANIAKDATVNLSVNFDHLGTEQITHLNNKTTQELTVDALSLVESGEYEMPWIYIPSITNGKLMQPFFNPISGVVEEVLLHDVENPGDYFNYEPRGIKIAPSATVAIASWFLPKNINLPETALRMILPEGSAAENEIISVNTKSAKDFPMRVGRAYHLYAVWNGNNLTMTDDDFVVEGLPKMTMTTALQPGERIEFSSIGFVGVVAQEDVKNVWIDMNNNGRRDEHEDGYKSWPNGQFYTINSFIVDSPTFSIYGKVTYFAMNAHPQLTQLDVSGNPELIFLFCIYNQLTELDLTKNVGLTDLTCIYNQLTELDMTGNINLTGVNCSANQIKWLDVTKNTKLQHLVCMENQLDQLNITNNGELINLRCGDNQLAQLDVSKNTELTILWCQDNLLKELDVTKNTELREFECYNNQLTELNVKNNINLTSLNCENNQLAELDLSKNVSLGILRCDSNLLTQLDVSHNRALVSLSCTSNNMETEALDRLYEQLPDIKDVTVREYEEEWKKHLNVSGNPGAETSNTQIAVDKGWIVDVQGSGGNVDLPRITMTTAKTVGELLNLSFDAAEEDRKNIWIDLNNNGVKDSGEDDFSHLVQAWIKIDSPTITIYGKVTKLFCLMNELTQLDVKESTTLEELVCSENLLTQLDVTKNKALRILYCYQNKLTQLDVSKNTQLTFLSCYQNQLKELGVEKNIHLRELICNNNQLTRLDISENPELTTLFCFTNQLTQLDVSKNSHLFALWCGANNMETDVLNRIYGQLPDIKNVTVEEKEKVWKKHLNVAHNPGAETSNTQIAVDKGWIVDVQGSGGNVDLPRISMTTAKTVGETITILVNAAEEDKKDVWIDLNNNGIKDDGEDVVDFGYGSNKAYKIYSPTIQIYGKVKELACYYNQLTELDVTQNPALEILYSEDNKLTELNVTNNPALRALNCYANQLTELNVTQNPALRTLNCYLNLFTELNVSNNPALQILNCYANQLTELDVTQNPALEVLFCGNNQLTELDVSKNTTLHIFVSSGNPLTCIQVNQEQLNKIPSNWSKDATAEYSLDCDGSSDVEPGVRPDMPGEKW